MCRAACPKAQLVSQARGALQCVADISIIGAALNPDPLCGCHSAIIQSAECPRGLFDAGAAIMVPENMANP